MLRAVYYYCCRESWSMCVSSEEIDRRKQWMERDIRPQKFYRVYSHRRRRRILSVLVVCVCVVVDTPSVSIWLAGCGASVTHRTTFPCCFVISWLKLFPQTSVFSNELIIWYNVYVRILCAHAHNLWCGVIKCDAWWHGRGWQADTDRPTTTWYTPLVGLS